MHAPLIETRDVPPRTVFALEQAGVHPLLAAAARGELARLTLCGARSSIEFAPPPRGWWQRIAAAIAPPRIDTRALLESL